jgi:hypothetical protein
MVDEFGQKTTCTAELASDSGSPRWINPHSPKKFPFLGA